MNETSTRPSTLPTSVAATVPAGTLVVGVDGSSASDAALAWAVEEARRSHRAITLVHAWRPTSSVWLDQAGVDHAALDREIRADAERMLDLAARRVEEGAPGTTVHKVARAEDPRAVLLDLSGRAHLVVVGSRGRGPLTSMLLGSVSAYVSRHGHCPVVVVRPGGPLPGEGRGVLVAVDGTDVSLPAVELAYEQAAARGLPLTVLHAVWDARVAAVGGTIDVASPAYDDVRALVAETLAGLAEKHPDVVCTTEVVHGLADAAVLEAAQGRELTVVGHRHVGRLGAMVLGSVAVHTLEHAEGIVVVVPGPA